MSPLGSDWQFVWCCRCGARAAKFAKKLGEPCVGHPRSQEYARNIRLLSSGWHSKDHDASVGQVAAKLPRGQQAVIRLRMTEAQPTNPDDKKHLLLKAGEIKWCWKCGARVERDTVQWSSLHQGVRESTLLARQRALCL